MGNTLSFRREFGFIIVGAIVLAASLMWKDILVEIGEKYFPRSSGIAGRIFYTIVITVILLMIAVHLKTIFKLTEDSKKDIVKLGYMDLANGHHEVPNNNDNRIAV